MLRYSKEVMEHFLRPKNAGRMDNPSGTGMIGDPDCGDSLQLFIRVDQDRIIDCKYLIKGCPAAMAVASALSELAIGKHVEDALFITDDDVVDVLGGLPEIKLHCSNLGASALQLALKDYYERRIKER
jgi:nitrogen fixation protein NifU and related proteins